MSGYCWLPVEQYSEREMAILSFDCLLKCIFFYPAHQTTTVLMAVSLSLSLSLGYHTRRKTGELLRILDRTDAINNFFETYKNFGICS
jgi:hypothetical protein